MDSLGRIQTLFGNREGSLFFIGQLMGPLGLVQYLFDAPYIFDITYLSIPLLLYIEAIKGEPMLHPYFSHTATTT